MITIERRRPNPIPAVHPVWEYRADETLRRKYDDVKSVIQVPWMGVVTMAYAHYTQFFDAWWAGLRETAASAQAVAMSAEARQLVEDGVAALNPPPIVGRLREMGYSDRELGDIRNQVEVFSHGNNAYLPVVFAATVLLEGGELGSPGSVATPYAGRHAPDVDVPFVFMEPHHATTETKAVYAEVMETLQLPFVNSDYRALSRWPTYFAVAWGDLRDVAGGTTHEALARKHHEFAVARVQELPNPTGLTSDALRNAAAEDATLDEVREMARLFAYLIPGLIVNVAYFRHQLLDDT